MITAEDSNPTLENEHEPRFPSHTAPFMELHMSSTGDVTSGSRPNLNLREHLHKTLYQPKGGVFWEFRVQSWVLAISTMPNMILVSREIDARMIHPIQSIVPLSCGVPEPCQRVQKRKLLEHITYPLVMTNIAIENDHSNSGFSH